MDEFGTELLGVIRKLSQMISGKMQQNNKVYHGEYMMLTAIYRLGRKRFEEEESGSLGVRVGDISRFMSSGKSATSKMLRCIEEKGYIERVNDTKDRRNVYVKLTESGKSVISESQQHMDEFAKHVLEQLGTEDAQNLIRIMKEVYRITEEEIKKKQENEK